MVSRKLIAALIVTHGVAGLVGFKVAQSLLKKDPGYVAELKTQDTKKQAVFDAATSAQASEGKDAKNVATADSKTPVTPKATPPEGWKARTVDMAIQSHGMSRVSFTSDAPLETIVGTTSTVNGTLRVNLGAPKDAATGEITVDIGSLRTGVDLRDEHLRGENFLNVEAYPKAKFTLTNVELADGALFPGATLKGTVHGSMTIHGKTQEIAAPVTLAYFGWNKKLAGFGIKGDLMRIQSRFDVKLADFGIEEPRLVGSKLAESVEIGLDLTALVAVPAPAEADKIKDAPAKK